MASADDVQPIVKIWEQRPLTRYTFAQLFRVDKPNGQRPVGVRLVIHRGGPAEEREFGFDLPAEYVLLF